MATKQDAATQTPRFSCVFNPVKDNPAEAENFVRSIFKDKPNNVDLVAAELAPLFGLGPNSSQNPLARLRAQAVFTSPQITEPLQEFLQYFVQDRWGLPLADWTSTLDLVHKHRKDELWRRKTLHPLVPNTGTPQQHYARFIIRMLEDLDNPYPQGAHLLLWLGDGIKKMELNEGHATKKVVAAYYFHKFFNQVSKLVSARTGAGELSPDIY